MKSGWFGTVVMLAGLLYFLVPLVFPLCPAAEGRVMKCFWSGRALMGIGAAVLAGGFLHFLTADRERRLGISLMIGVLALLGAAVPSFLIGVCANEAMLCRSGALPAWMLVSGFLFLASVINVRGLAHLGRESGGGE